MKFDVEFTLNRLPLMVQHRAVELASKHQLGEVLFPSGAATDTSLDTPPADKLRCVGYRSTQDAPTSFFFFFQ